MKYIIILFFGIFTINASAQDSTEVNIYNSVLQVGEGFDFGNGTIKFKQVVSDSRCPREVTCVWAGEAKILVEFYEGGNLISERILPVSEINIPLESSAEGILYKISRMVLKPYPTVQNEGEKVQYTLHIGINEEISGS